MTPVTRCAHHKPDSLGYLAAHEDAERRIRRGEEQTQCPVCWRWFWADQMGTPDRYPPCSVSRGLACGECVECLTRVANVLADRIDAATAARVAKVAPV